MKNQHPSTQEIKNATDSVIVKEGVENTVKFTWSGCPGIYARQQLEGIVIDAQTTKRGERYLLVKAVELNIPKWVRIKDVQFIQTKTATAA